MAITWDIQITNVNLSNGRGNITATRTDSESALAPRVHLMTNTPISTAAERALALNTIKEWDTTASDKLANVATFLDNLEQSAKTNLETWELTR